MSQPTDYSIDIKPKGILKKGPYAPDNSMRLRWDEQNLKDTEEQKSATMKIDEPRTPYIRYNPENDMDLKDLDEMEDLKLASGMSSRSSSVASSPKRAQVVAPSDWASDSEDDEETEVDRAKHERFRRLRKQHYHLEGRYVHEDQQFANSDDSAGSSDGNDTSGDEAGGRGGMRRARGGSESPVLQVSKGFKETYCAEDDPTGVDDINAASMEL